MSTRTFLQRRSRCFTNSNSLKSLKPDGQAIFILQVRGLRTGGGQGGPRAGTAHAHSDLCRCTAHGNQVLSVPARAFAVVTASATRSDSRLVRPQTPLLEPRTWRELWVPPVLSFAAWEPRLRDPVSTTEDGPRTGVQNPCSAGAPHTQLCTCPGRATSQRGKRRR